MKPTMLQKTSRLACRTFFRRGIALCSAAVAALAVCGTALAEDAYVYSPNGSGNNGVGVNTGYFMKPTSRIEVDFQYPTAPDAQFLFGEWGSASDFGLSVGFWINDSKFSFILRDNRYQSYPSTLAPDTARHTAIIDVPSKAFKLLSASGVEEWSGTAYNSTCNNVAKWPIVLFGSAADASGAGRQFSAPKIYSVKIYETENGERTLVHSLVPCMKGRDAGFYDEKTGEFLYGRGKYELVCGGDDVKTIPDDGYLQSNGSQTFNTGYHMTPTSRIEVSFQYPTAPSGNFLFGAWFNDNDHGLSSGCWNNSGKYGFICADGKYSNNGFNGTVSCSDTNRFTAVIDVASNVCQLVRNGYVRYNDVKNNTCANANPAAWPTVLFASANSEEGDGKQFTSVRIYSAKIYEREASGTYTLKKNFVPYEKAGVPGFMEKVSGVFKAVSKIASGGNIENDESASCAYVENGGTPAAALNLNYYANMSSRIEVDYKLLKAAGGSRGIFGAWGSGDLHYCLWNNGEGTISFIFQGKGRSSNQSAVVGQTTDTERHLAIVDFKNKSLAYVTDGVTNNVTVNASAQFNDTDVSSLPLYVFGFMKADEGPGMVVWSRIYSVRIYENDVLKHEFLPYTDGTANTLRDIITGYVATKANPETADLTIAGMGVDGAERCIVTPQSATVRVGRSVTLNAWAVGAVSRYRWTLNGEAVVGGADGELVVPWRRSPTPDVYEVRPVYSTPNGEVEGAAVSATVVNRLTEGLSVLIR